MTLGHITLPAKPANAKDLSEVDLETVAGGATPTVTLIVSAETITLIVSATKSVSENEGGWWRSHLPTPHLGRHNRVSTLAAPHPWYNLSITGAAQSMWFYRELFMTQQPRALSRHDLETKIIKHCWEDEAFRK
jgi:hypothetical protein